MTRKPETLAQAERKYEKSEADRRRDAAGAKKAGVSVATYERSADDRREDRANAKKLQARDNRGLGMVKKPGGKK